MPTLDYSIDLIYIVTLLGDIMIFFDKLRQFLVFGLVVPSVIAAEQLSVSVNAESAIMINASTGVVLFEKNADALKYPASVTKIPTAVYALKMVGDNLDVMVTADQDAIGSVTEEAKKRSNYTLPAYWLIPGASHIGIKKGEELSFRTLMYGLMLASGDDAANVIAMHVSGTVPNFMTALNAYLKELGCKNTLLFNPHGLHYPKHQTTARDMALIMQEALKNPTLCEIMATVQYKRPKTNKQESTMMVQTNRLLRKGKVYYPKAIGGKTGYYSTAGHSLAVAARDGDRTLIVVLFKCKEREEIFRDAIALFDAAFKQNKVQRLLLKSGSQTFTCDVPGASTSLKTYLKEDVNLTYYPAEEVSVKCLLYWEKLTLPIVKDQKVGELRLQAKSGHVVQIVPIFAEEDVSATWLWSLKNIF
jgi:D-alanyl-D-alanine carboxypeptidase (penicillin-binding protein 5/6)